MPPYPVLHAVFRRHGMPRRVAARPARSCSSGGPTHATGFEAQGAHLLSQFTDAGK